MSSDLIENYRKLLQTKVVLSSENGVCQLWHRTSKGYGRISITFQGVTKTVYAHRLSYFLNKGDISSLWDKSITDSCSHLCHNSLCINAEHISLEPSHINNERKCCLTSNMCMHHDGFRDCLLHLKI